MDSLRDFLVTRGNYAMQQLSEIELQTKLVALNTKAKMPWVIKDGKLRKEFAFNDFKEAFAFMTKVAEVAEAMDHHPDWSNSYKRVTIELMTHDAQGITDLDFELAEKIENLLV